MKLLKAFSLIFIVLFALCSSGCDESNSTEVKADPATSKTKSDEAYKMMEDEFTKLIDLSIGNSAGLDQMKFAQINSLYKEAVGLDAQNHDAQFGAAITEILSVYSDSEVNKLLKEIEDTLKSRSINRAFPKGIIPVTSDRMSLPVDAVAENIFLMHKLAIQEPGLISKIQTVLGTRVLPRVDYALARLAEIEKNPSFKFTVSGKMQGNQNSTPVSIYITEIYLTDAALNALKAALDIFMIYKFELKDFNAQTVASALQPNNQEFFVLAPDGKARASEVKTSFITAIDKFKQGITSLETISGSKTDAAIKLGNNGIRQADLDSVKKYLEKARNLFTQNVTFNAKNADSEGNDYDVTVNIGNFLDNLAQNPKTAYLPAYTVSAEGNKVLFKFNAESYNEFSFPDPTFSNLFPGMTNEKLKRLLFIDEEFAFRFSVYAEYEGSFDNWTDKYIRNAVVKLITTDGHTYQAHENKYGYGGYDFFIREATKTPVKVTRMLIEVNGKETELVNMVGSSLAPDIVAKKYNWAGIRIPLQPFNFRLEKQSSEVKLTWNVRPDANSAGFIIERKTGSRSFEKLTELYCYSHDFTYTDLAVSPGNTYTYRISNVKYQIWGNEYFYMPKDPYYSNEASVSF